MNRRYIEEYAEKIYEALSLTEGFNIYSIVEGLGGKIEEGSLNNGVVAELGNLSDSDEEASFVIKVSNDIFTDGRRRFSIAHELGHLFIHLDFLDDEKWKANCQRNFSYHREEVESGLIEVEANIFAAAFLMPKKDFIKVAEKNKNDIDKIAKSFIVSKKSAYYRGVNLGIWR